MPLVRLKNGKLLYFSHVPKCAGTAIENYLAGRFGPLGMLDPSYGLRGMRDGWSLTPPQHMPEEVRRDLFPDTLFDAIFASVRHPALRLRSVFMFQREGENALPKSLTFERWIKSISRTIKLDPYALHGHLRPMTDQVPPAAHVFRIEDGLERVVHWIDSLADDEEGQRYIEPTNVMPERLKPEAPELTYNTCGIIREIYDADYRRFGYRDEPSSDLVSMNS